MGFIKDFIAFLVDTITTVWDFFIGLVEDIILVVQYIGMAFTMAATGILTLPSWLGVFATISIGVSVAYLILGRSTGKGE